MGTAVEADDADEDAPPSDMAETPDAADAPTDEDELPPEEEDPPALAGVVWCV